MLIWSGSMMAALSAVFSLVLLQATPAPPAKAGAAPMALFVCEHGAAKSVIAAAWFNRLAKEKGLPHRAVFRGANPEDDLTPATRAGLTRDGFDVRDWSPVKVASADVNAAEIAVVFACQIPGKPNPSAISMDWGEVPNVSDGYESARDAIVAHVKALVDQLARRK